MACFATDAVFEGAGVGGVAGDAFRVEALLEGQRGRRQSVRRLLPSLVQGAMTGAARLAAEHSEAWVGAGHSAELLGGPEGDRPEPGQDSENHYQARV